MVDVCLILEGTYPFVTGGVSSWVHQLVSNLPGLEFGIIHISSSQNAIREHKYKMPSNIKFLQEVFLHDYAYAKMPKLKKKRSIKLSPDDQKLIQELSNWDYKYFTEHMKFLFENNSDLSDYDRMIFSKETWDFIVDQYSKQCPDQSFLDYFWTWRFTNMPLLRLLGTRIPKAKMYHTISTGFAGFLAVLAKIRYDAPLMLTEHGIYTKERKIEIQSSEWIYQTETLLSLKEKRDFFKRWWVDMFRFSGRACYDYCDQIITLYEGNKVLEIRDGADAEKIEVIPNGVYLKRYDKLKEQFFSRDRSNSYVIGFVGRVVPIKDVKTFIRAIKIIYEKIPQVHVIIMGPTEEDKAYYAECSQLVELLELQEAIEFTGPVQMSQYYPKLDLVVLTSISEAQPLVILEANAIGIPVVASNVGACRELLFGRTEEDRAIGPSGAITPIAHPNATAKECIRILSDFSLRETMGRNGLKRVQSYYRQEELLSRYYTLYETIKNRQV